MPAPLDRTRFAGWEQPADLRAEWARLGLHTDATMGAALRRRLARNPGRVAVIDQDQRITAATLLACADGLAGTLRAAGVGPGDVVSWQVPNWWEALVIALATWQVGAVNNPILMIYREHELRQIYEDLAPAVVVAPATFRGRDHVEEIDALLDSVGHEPQLRLSVRGSLPGWTPLGDAMLPKNLSPALAVVHPDDPCIVAYTSGTTAGAKGVVLSSRGLMAETWQMRDNWGVAWHDVCLMPAPLAHLTGVTVGITVPLTAGASVVLLDVWDAERAFELIERERCSVSSGTPIFLEEIVSAHEARGAGPSPIREYSVGGQAVAPALIDRAEVAGVGAFRCYGMTEHMSTTIANSGLPLEVRRDSDGPVGPGSEAIATADGRRLPAGETGDIWVRGPERMLGYLAREHNEAALVPGEGWFKTGDVGSVDSDGIVRISGRVKDIINRGGEKFSAREMEHIICRHPAISQAAVVPQPDRRFGEVPAAFVVASGPDSPPSAEELVAFVRAEGLAKQKTPVSWQLIDQLPRTPFGKIKKNELAARLSL